LKIIKKRKISENKETFSRKTLFTKLKDSGLLEIIEKVTDIYKNNWQTENIRNQVFDVFVGRICRLTGVRSRKVSNSIIKSLRYALKQNKSYGGRMKSTENQYAFNIIVKAASYYSGTNKKVLARALDISSRSSIFKTFDIKVSDDNFDDVELDYGDEEEGGLEDIQNIDEYQDLEGEQDGGTCEQPRQAIQEVK
jgi:hypothetical protein